MKKNCITGRLFNLVKKHSMIERISSQSNKFEKIIEYKEEYKEKTSKHIINVCVEEYGFEEWRMAFENFRYEEYRGGKANFWIAVNEKDDVIGTIALRNKDNNNVGELKSFYVQKEYRGSGISKELFDKCIEFAKYNGYKKIVLDTYERFHRAISFYKKNHFKEANKIGEKYILELSLLDDVEVAASTEDEMFQQDVLEYVI